MAAAEYAPSRLRYLGNLGEQPQGALEGGRPVGSGPFQAIHPHWTSDSI